MLRILSRQRAQTIFWSTLDNISLNFKRTILDGCHTKKDEQMCWRLGKETKEMQMVKTYFLGSFVKGRNSQKFWPTLANQFFRFFASTVSFVHKKTRNFFKTSNINGWKQSVEEHAFIFLFFFLEAKLFRNTNKFQAFFFALLFHKFFRFLASKWIWENLIWNKCFQSGKKAFWRETNFWREKKVLFEQIIFKNMWWCRCKRKSKRGLTLHCLRKVSWK